MNSASFAILPTDELLKRTTSRCPICHAACPAEVWRTGGIPAKIFLKRACPDHGEASFCIASDARFYWLAKGKAENACCGLPESAGVSPANSSERANVSGRRDDGAPRKCCSADGSNLGTLGRNADPGDALGIQEKLSTCLALIEIVTSCNLPCPTCYANSPIGTGQKVEAVPLENLKQRIQGVIDRKGGIEILQLSGGEPTLHPQFFELLHWLHAHPGIDYVLLNTNGVRIAQDPAFARELGATFRYGRFQLYLQFDGAQEQGQKFLRGADLRATRERCLAVCGEMNLPITLAMTVTPDNLPFLWDAIEFGLRWPNVRGISFQPMFTSGRVPQRLQVEGYKLQVKQRGALATDERSTFNLEPVTRLNTADIILAAVAQSRGKLRFEDFTPLPCGDPNCATIGYLLKVGVRPSGCSDASGNSSDKLKLGLQQVRSVSDFVDFTRVQDFLGTKVRYKLEDLMKCGCESEPLGELLKRFEIDESHTFRLFIKPFMDAATWDEDRIDRCCTHVIRPDGKLDSFCRYYSGFADCQKT
ncbi:MAG TPA: radical SAM protein [Candidatus Eisenbacteria bacterium]|nr:radical SAM protein [Candidatus Eisenbacteria bacterium]